MKQVNQKPNSCSAKSKTEASAFHVPSTLGIGFEKFSNLLDQACETKILDSGELDMVYQDRLPQQFSSDKSRILGEVPNARRLQNRHRSKK